MRYLEMSWLYRILAGELRSFLILRRYRLEDLGNEPSHHRRDIRNDRFPTLRELNEFSRRKPLNVSVKFPVLRRNLKHAARAAAPFAMQVGAYTQGGLIFVFEGSLTIFAPIPIRQKSPKAEQPKLEISSNGSKPAFVIRRGR